MVLIFKNINSNATGIFERFFTYNTKKIVKFTKKNINFIRKLFLLMKTITIKIPNRTKSNIKNQKNILNYFIYYQEIVQIQTIINTVFHYINYLLLLD